MANIPLMEGYRLKSDSRQWVFQSQIKDDKHGNEQWNNIGYYGTLQGAVKGSYAYFLRKSDADSIESFMNDSKQIFNKMVELLSPVMEINEK